MVTLSLALLRLDPGFIAGDFRPSLPPGVRAEGIGASPTLRTYLSLTGDGRAGAR